MAWAAWAAWEAWADSSLPAACHRNTSKTNNTNSIGDTNYLAKDSIKLRPLDDRVVVEFKEADEEVTADGIVTTRHR